MIGRTNTRKTNLVESIPMEDLRNSTPGPTATTIIRVPNKSNLIGLVWLSPLDAFKYVSE